MSNGFALPYASTNEKTRVVFAAVGDSEIEDEGLQPPLVRDRYTDQNNIALVGDYTNQANSLVNTSEWQIGSGPNAMFNARIKKFTPSFVGLALYAPCVNTRNNTLIFRVPSDPTRLFTATIRPFNYRKLVCNARKAALPAWPSSAQHGINGGYGVAPYDVTNANTVIIGDPNEGLLTWTLTALNTAVDQFGVPYNPAVDGEFIGTCSNGFGFNNQPPYYNSQTNEVTTDGLFGTIGNPLFGFEFVGGTMFQRGLHTLGLTPLGTIGAPSFYTTYEFGPAKFQYTRWVDICSNELTQFSKLKNSGYKIPPGLLIRLIAGGDSQVGLQNIDLSSFRQQQINMRKDYAMSHVDLFLLDEYGERYLQMDGPNISSIMMVLCAQL